MELIEAVKERRSIRSFKSDEVSDDKVRILIDAATYAPSAGNIQPWEFITIRSVGMKKKLVAAAHEQSFIEQVPVVVVVCANEILSSGGYGLRGKNLFCLQDTAAAIQNMLLTAHSLGLGTCWIGSFEEDEVRRILKIPEGIRPIAIIPVGIAAKAGVLRKKRSIEDIIHRETFHKTVDISK